MLQRLLHKWFGWHFFVWELALHRIAGHGNITGEKSREIAAESLGEKEARK